MILFVLVMLSNCTRLFLKMLILIHRVYEKSRPFQIQISYHLLYYLIALIGTEDYFIQYISLIYSVLL